MNKTLILLGFLFISQASTSNSFLNENSPLTNLLVGKNGIIPFTKLTSRYYAVSVDLVSQGQSVYMLPALYSSETLLTENCLGFNNYTCSNYTGCSQDASQAYPVLYPTFSATGYKTKANLFLDYQYWSLNTATDGAINTISCTPATELTDDDAFGKGTYGLLGLGYQDNAKSNFIGSTSKFAINGINQLEINPNLDFSKEQVSVLTGADANWQVSGYNSIQIGNDSYPISNSKIIFDLNFLFVGLPKPLVDKALLTFAKYNIICSNYMDIYLEIECKCNIVSSAMPSIQLSGSGSSFTLTPSIYMMVPTYSDSTNQIITSFTLNLVGLDTSSTLYRVTPQYENTIILGLTYISNYYTVFDSEAKTITVFNDLRWAEIMQGLSNFVKLIILGVVIILVTVLVLCCFCCGGVAFLATKLASKKSNVANNGHYVAPNSFNDSRVNNPQFNSMGNDPYIQ